MEDDLNRKILLSLGFLVVFVLSACKPNLSALSPNPTLAPQPDVLVPAIESTAIATAVVVMETEPPTEEVVVSLPTSRGNELHATDPATVNIGSGRPQLIEFFAFW